MAVAVDVQHAKVASLRRKKMITEMEQMKHESKRS
jgi:hypothetical protein